MPEQVETPEGGCDPMGSPHWSKLLAGPVDLWREEPTPEQYVQFSPTPQYDKDINKLEHVQQRTTKMAERLEHFPYQRGIGLLQPGEGMALRGTQEQAPSTYEEAIDGARFFTVVCGRRMGDNRNNLKEVRFRLDIKENFFTMRTDRHWPMLSGKTAQSIFGGFQNLNKALCFGLVTSRGPFQSEFSYDLTIL
ncbi:hypothetical protein GRJ2_000743000 [Grus japonensis]|uniref:Uncharacterized protein n=1 Tax=Grus japonensis TaxID=30415 RepID=A0ABC9WCP1_GRUJA